ncbi:MAG: C-terminal binding protein [Candidatus Bipolaricaulis sp.]|nr:C-terminal binding protein [Candidatus Bipolaricaulis sp.]
MMAANKPVLLKPYGNADRERRIFSDVAEVRNPSCATEKELSEAVADADVLIADVDIQVTRPVLAGAKRLRGVMACSIGVDYVDLQAATELGIYVANLPDYCINAVAEFAIGLVFSAARHIPQGVECVRSQNWNGRRVLKGIELRGRRLGLVGFGKIGQLVGQKGLGLGMTVSYFDPLVGPKSPVSGCTASASLDELLASSDVVSVHVPLTAGTRGLLSYEALTRMKPSALLVNVSRGGIVDEADLYRALKEKKLAGAALDVLAIEPIEPNHPLTTLDNVLITPHMAWNTEESKANSEDSIVEQVHQLLEGRPPTHLVNRDVVPHGRTR